MIKKFKSNLFIKIFLITFLLTSVCCFTTYSVISCLLPKTYSTTLDTNLDNSVTLFLGELEKVSPLESGKLFDEFQLNNANTLLQLYDENDNEIELPSQDSTKFPTYVTTGAATENADPTAYRATHSYLFSFADTDKVYTLSVAGSSQEITLLKDTLGSIFLALFFVIFLIAVIASVIYSHYITKPVLQLSSVSRKMSELNFDWKCDENRTDELGTLAHSLNEMSKRLSASLEDLRTANKKLQADIEHERELEQTQLEFFSAVSHELKTPLTIIKGQTEGMILNVGDYQNRNKYLSRSLEIINTMQNMVQEILTVSHIKSSNTRIQKDYIDFSAMLTHEYIFFEDMIVNKRIHWNENISPNLTIMGDESLIQKVINNLVLNAVSYSPEESSITITAFQRNGNVVFELENTGVHIPKNEIPKLFDAFYRIEHSRNRKTGGSGLGLYIVKSILEQHQATYSINNTSNGVLFSIHF